MVRFVSRQNEYHNLAYDQNGNILKLSRSGTAESPEMDKLAYTYEAASNQLAYVADEVAPSAYPNDLDGQQPNNYEYNKIGQLMYNKQDDVGYDYYTSGLTKAIYNGKIGEAGSTKRVEFQYNESGHRIKKLSYNQEGTLLKTTFYVRDAAGTPIAIYYKDEGNTDKSIILAENILYGSSRLGTMNRITETTAYEIQDHLGNVRALVAKGENNQPIAVLGTADYYPFGMPFPDEQNLDYRYAYQGQEKDEETNMEAFQLRLWDSRIGRWLTPDPYGQYASPYLGMGNNPINLIDPNGGTTNPIYDQDTGEFLGTDSKGLLGDAIFMNKADFTQGMDHDLAMSQGMDEGMWVSSKADLGMINTFADSFERLASLPTIGSRELTFTEQWSQSDSFFGKLSYSYVNDLYTVLQVVDFDLLAQDRWENPFTGASYGNLDGTPNYNQEMSFLHGTFNFVPAGKAIEGLRPFSKLNAAQFSKMFKGNLSKLSPQNRGVINRSLNRTVDNVNSRIGSGTIVSDGVGILLPDNDK